MDLAKVPNDKKLNLCRWYFRGNLAVTKVRLVPSPLHVLVGCALLPFVWTINAIWFYNEAFRKPEYEEQKQIRKYVIFSAIGSAIWFMLLVTWVTIFQLNRASWGAFADHISFIIPVGTP